MSTPHITTGHTGPRKHWDPALTQREALKVGFSKSEYDSAALYARMTVDAHKDLGTLRDRWEPTPDVGDLLSAPYIGNGEQELAGRLESEADPRIDESQGLVESVKEGLDEIREDARPIAAPEFGATYSVPGPWTASGRTTRRSRRTRAPASTTTAASAALLRRLATWAPWIEAAGFFTFISYYLNVPMFRALAGLVRLVLRRDGGRRHHHRPDHPGAARCQDHNHAREAYANGNRHRRKPAGSSATGTS